MAAIVVLIHFAEGAPPLPAQTEAPAGLLGASVWRRQEEETRALVALHFENERAAADNLKRIVEGTMGKADDGHPLPNAVEHLVIEEASGRSLETTEIGGYAVFGRLVSDPGYGDEARTSSREFLPVFAGLPGFQGYLFGHNQALEEETMAILLSSEPPPSGIASDFEMKIEVFRRVE